MINDNNACSGVVDPTLLGRCIVPYGMVRRTWDVTVVIIAAITMLYEPLLQLFSDNRGAFDSLSFAMDFVMLLDGPINALTAYVTPQQTIICNPTQLCKLYCLSGRRWMFGAVTLVTFCSAFTPSFFAVTLVLRMCRVVRLVSPGTGTYADHFDITHGSHFALRIFLLFISLLGFAHFIGCVYRHVWMHYRETDVFYPSIYNDEDSDTWLLYMATFRASITMLVTAELKDCTGPVENAFAILVSLSMLVIASLMIGECSLLMTYLRRDEMEFQCEVVRMRSFLTRRKTPMPLQEEVIEFVRHRYEHGVTYDASLMNQLPSTLVYKLRSTMLGDIASSVPIFRGADADYIRCIMVKLSYRFFFAGDTIYHHGELDQRMFLLLHGRVSLTNRVGDIVTVLYNGAHFGEAGVLAEHHRREFTALALIYTDACHINRDDLNEIHFEFPDRRKLLESIEQRRRSQLTKGVYFNDDTLVENAMLNFDMEVKHRKNAAHEVPVKFFASDLKNLHLHNKRNSQMTLDQPVLHRVVREAARAATRARAETVFDLFKGNGSRRALQGVAPTSP